MQPAKTPVVRQRFVPRIDDRAVELHPLVDVVDDVIGALRELEVDGLAAIWLLEIEGETIGDPAPASAPIRMVIKGDGLCASIAAASVLAKVERDALMRAAHVEHPEYGWDGNKGYGAQEHLDAIRELGPTAWHRVSWKLPATSTCQVPT